MSRPVVLLALAAAATTAAATAAPASAPPSPSKLAPIHGPYHPRIDRRHFVRRVDNRFLPFIPGTRLHYEGVSEGTPQADDEVVLHRTKRILGVRSTVVRDEVSEHGTVVERTFDYYAEDRHGNVWYMGELALERHHGRLVKAGDSWLGGVKGGRPGIIMPGRPRRGDSYRQEYFPRGGALDEARVIGRRGTVTVPAGTYRRPLVTFEHSPSDPQTEKKYYAPGVGEIAEHVVKGGHEAFRLVSVTR